MITIRLLDDVSTNHELVNSLFNHLDTIRNGLNLESETKDGNSVILYYELLNRFKSFENNDDLIYSDLNVSDSLMKKFYVSDLELILSPFPHYVYQYNMKDKMFLIFDKRERKNLNIDY